MRSRERISGLLRAPMLTWDVILRGRYDFVYDMMRLRMSRMSMAKRFNLLKAGANLVYRRLTPWSMPLHMQFELTNYCNLRCPVCPTGTRALERKPCTKLDRERLGASTSSKPVNRSSIPSHMCCSCIRARRNPMQW